MDSPSPPPAPDPQVTAAAQGAANVESARVNASLNRPNQYTPYGNLTWNNDGGDRWSSKVSLDPRAQRVLDAQMATSMGLNGATTNALGRVDSTMQQPLVGADDLAGFRQKAEDNVYQRHTRMLDPQIADSREALRSQLMNRGFMDNTEAFQKEMDRFERGATDQYGQARSAAVSAGGAEVEQQMAQQLRSRNQIINELASLRTGQQVQTPQFQSGMSGANAAPAPFAQSAYNSYQGQMGQYNAEVGANNSTMGAAAGLAGAGLGAWGAAAGAGAMMF